MAASDPVPSNGLLDALTAPFRKSRRSSASTRQYDKPSLNGDVEKELQRQQNSTAGTSETRVGRDLEKQGLGDGEYADKQEIGRAHEDGLDRRRYMRVVPAWVKEDEIEQSRPSGGYYPGDSNGAPLEKPRSAQSAQHNHTPAPKHSRPAGRRFDYARDGHSLMAIPLEEDETSQLMEFMRESAPPQDGTQQGQIMSREWMEQNVPDFTEPWQPAWIKADGPKDKRFWLFSPEKRMNAWNSFLFILMRNPFVPLITRLTVLAFVLAALGLGVTIYRDSRSINSNPRTRHDANLGAASDENAICKQQTSTFMAFIVDAFAVLYVVYITWDEYFSKPLGLRLTKDKIRLLFLDLLFVIFSAANLGLAFNTLTDQQWSCYSDPTTLNSDNAEAARSTCIYDEQLCRRQKGLCAVLLLAEIAWVLAFAISIFRVVERIQR